METKDEMHTYAYGNVNITTQQITANVILLNGFDLTQLLQSLTDRINALELEIKVSLANVDKEGETPNQDELHLS